MVFLSNYFNHHQKSICEELNASSKSFCFVSTSEMREDRKKLGYGEDNIPDYVRYAHRTEQEKKECIRLASEADAVVIGSAPEEMIRSRIEEGKLVFRYSERPLKKGFEPLKYFPRYLRWHSRNPKNKPIYMLCASAYTVTDYARFGLFRDSSYKWGYFPATNTYDIDGLIKQKNKIRILWCGRFIDWKHPDDVVKLAELLKKDGCCFEICFIGTGEMETGLKQSVKDKKLDDCVTFLGSMKPEQVRSHMEQSGIFLFTSDRQEGWGAVLNESMNSGCAVVASHAIGSVPYLIDNGKNGLVYRSGDVEMLYEKVKYLLDNPDEQERLGRSAYDTITKEWNAKVAAERLVNLSQHILNGEKHPDLYESGPCSRAEIIKDDWFNE